MKKGFTLIEVMVVAVIVAILAAVAIPAYNGYIERSSNNVAMNVAGTVASACGTLASENHGSGYTIGALTSNATNDIGGGISIRIPDGVAITIASGAVTGSHVKGTGTVTANF